MGDNGKLFYGWRIVSATFLILFVGLSSGFYTVSVFLEPLQAAFGWTRTQISLGFTISAILVGLMSPAVGVAVSKLGVKKVQLFGAVVVSAGLLGASFLQTLLQYYAIYVIVAIGLAAVGIVPSQTVISHWFEKRRGTAMGIIMMGIGLGGMSMVLVASMVNDAYGWRWAYRVLALLVAGIVIPLVLFVIRNNPREMGLVPDGVAVPKSAARDIGGKMNLTVPEAFRTLPFHLTNLITVLFSVILGGLTLHAIALLRSYGFEQANMLWSLTLGVSVLGRILFGYLSDRIPKKTLVLASWVCHILAFASIMMVAGQKWYIAGFVIFYGFSLGSFVTLLPLFVGDKFGVEHFSKLIGIVGLFQIIGLAAGSIIMGKIFDATGSYANGITAMLVISIISLFITMLIGQPRAAVQGRAAAGA